MSHAKRPKFDPSLAKARALDSYNVRTCVEDIRSAAERLCAVPTVPLFDDFSSEKSIELFLVARLGLKGVECLRTATFLVPSNFCVKRIEFVAEIFSAISGIVCTKESCERYLSLLQRCSAYSVRVDSTQVRDIYLKELLQLSEQKGIGCTFFLSPPVDRCINPRCPRVGSSSSLSIHHAPVNVTIFSTTGPLPGCKVALKCSTCSVIYNYCKYGNKLKEGERFYNDSRELVEVSDVVYCERQMSGLFNSLKYDC